MAIGGATVFGASGFIGTRLVAALAERRQGPVTAVDLLPPRKVVSGVRYVAADVRSPLSLDLSDKAEVIFNLAAVHRTPGHPPQAYYDTNVYGALNVCDLARRAAIPKIVFTSSISVYGPSEELLDEQSPVQPVSDYGRSKLMAERIHSDWAQEDSTRQLAIVRPAVVFGPGEGGNYTRLAKALQKGYFVYPGRRDTIKSGGYVDELIGTFDFALARSDRRVLYNFAFPELSTTADIVATFSRVLNKRFSPPTAPLAPVLAATRIAQALRLSPSFHPERVMKLVQSTRIRPGWLLHHGYPYRFDLTSALTRWRDETQSRFD